MSNNHLSEDQFQAYAQDLQTQRAFDEHLSSCADCQRQVKTYQLLFHDIREAPAPELNPDIAEFIFSQWTDFDLKEQQDKNWLSPLFFGMALLLISAVAVFWPGISWLFVDLPYICIAIVGVLILALALMQIKELYYCYKQKIRILNLLSNAT